MHALKRFLKARNWDAQAAEAMWSQQCEWREKMKVEALLSQSVLSKTQQRRLMQLYPHGLHGIDVMVGHQCSTCTPAASYCETVT